MHGPLPLEPDKPCAPRRFAQPRRRRRRGVWAVDGLRAERVCDGRNSGSRVVPLVARAAGTESSRSTRTMSTASVGALARARWFEAGTVRHARRSRFGRFGSGTARVTRLFSRYGNRRGAERLMDFALSPELDDIRKAVREFCSRHPGEYWRSLEPDRYPEEFVGELTKHGWLAALIPEAYGGAGLGLTAASVVLEEVNGSGGNAAACHAQMYVMGTLLRHGSDEQKERYLPGIPSGEVRLQAFGITEPSVGSDTTQIQTRAERVDGGYTIHGEKMWTSRALHSDLMLLLAGRLRESRSRSEPRGFPSSWSISRAAPKLDIRPIRTMMNHAKTGSSSTESSCPARSRRRGGEGLPLHPRRDERRADPACLGAHR